MTIKDLLIEELSNVSDPLMVEVLDFLRFLKAKQVQDSPALVEARTSLAPNTHKPLVRSGYSLQGQEPYQYDDPFAPAVPLEEWDVLQ